MEQSKTDDDNDSVRYVEGCNDSDYQLMIHRVFAIVDAFVLIAVHVGDAGFLQLASTHFEVTFKLGTWIPPSLFCSTNNYTECESSLLLFIAMWNQLPANPNFSVHS